jgi:hypothetical protein
MNEITEQVSLETGSDPAQVKGVVQNLALTNSIKGGNTQDLINNIEMKVTQPNDQVSKSLNSLAMQEEKGNYEVVNTAVERVAEGAVGGNDIEQLVTMAAATTEGAAGGELGAAALNGGAPPSLDEETTGDEGEIAGEVASEEDDDSDSEEEAGTADEDEAAASDESEDGGDDGGGDDGGDEG